MDEKVKSAGPADEIELEFYLNQVNRFLDNLYENMTAGFHARAGGDISKEMALVFFHSKERYDNLKMLMQYLVYFVREISDHSIAAEGLDKPYEQFRNLISFQINLLLEVDVQIAIMREYMQVLPLKEHKLDSLEKKILHQHQELRAMLDAAAAPALENLPKLFEVLRQFSRFWFDLKNHQYQRVRRSDFYIFKLSNLLIEKYLPGKDNLAYI